MVRAYLSSDLNRHSRKYLEPSALSLITEAAGISVTLRNSACSDIARMRQADQRSVQSTWHYGAAFTWASCVLQPIALLARLGVSLALSTGTDFHPPDGATSDKPGTGSYYGGQGRLPYLSSNSGCGWGCRA